MKNSARHVTKKKNQQQHCMRHEPAAMMHGGGGVLFIITTKFASQETQKTENNVIKALSLTTISTTKNKTKSLEICQDTKQTPPSNKLTTKTQYFQMRKMDQR
jgi:hypothetical protein